MRRKEPTKTRSIDALDSIVNVLKEHNDIIEKLTNEVEKIISQREKGDLNNIERVEEKISRVQADVGNLSNFLSTSAEGNALVNTGAVEEAVNVQKVFVEEGKPPAVVRCKQWVDFQELASGAQTVAFMYIESEKAFEADALKSQNLNMEKLKSTHIHNEPKSVNLWRKEIDQKNHPNRISYRRPESRSRRKKVVNGFSRKKRHF